MIAEVVHPAADLATRRDLDGFRGEVREEFAKVRTEIHIQGSRNVRWLLAFFVPVWIGTWGTVIAVLVKS